MGVRGLSSLIDNNPQLLSDHKLSNCSLVIDGNNLCYKLYRRFHCNVFAGGDYNVFHASCTEFFAKFQRCSIVPYVVFDGAHNIGDSKLKTTMHRAKERLSKARLMTQGYSVIGGFLPILALIVFEDVLRDLDIRTFVHSDYEADDQIVVLSNELECPVLSEDSDFFIYDLKGGFIPFGSLNFNVLSMSEGEEESEKRFYLSVKIYFVDNFLKNFKDLDRSLLPLFAVLTGNDYVDENDVSSFFRNVIDLKKCSRSGFGKLNVRKSEQKIISLLAWLRSKKTVDEAVEVVASHLKVQSKKQLILNAVDSYRVRKSYIVNELGSGEDEVVAVTSSNGSSLPLWFVRSCRRGEFPQFLMNAAVHRRAILNAQLERWDLESSYASSLHLRRVIYAMMFPVSSDGDDASIVEIGRKRNKTHTTQVVPLRELSDGRLVPSYEEVRDLDRETRLKFLMEVLGVLDYEVLFDVLPLDWHLFVCIVIYWVRSAQIKLTHRYLDSVILMGIYVNFVSPCRVENCTNILSDQDILKCQNRLSGYQRDHSSFANGQPPNVSSLHSFGELQTCLLFAECLNCLLDRPLLHLHIASFVNGTFVYNMNENLTKRSDSESFCVQLLGKDTLVYEFFCKVRALITQRLSADLFEIVTEPSYLRNVRRNKRKPKKRVKGR